MASQFDDFDMYDELEDQIPQADDFDGEVDGPQPWDLEDDCGDDPYGDGWDDGRYDDDPDPYSGTGTW